MRFARLFLALTMLSCADGRVMHGDVTFTSGERDSIAFANEWMAARVGRLPFVLVWDLPHPDDSDEVFIGPSIRRGVSPSQPMWAEAILGSRGRIAIDVDYVNASAVELEVVVAHELGHAWGCRHHDGLGIMNFYHSPRLEWTVGDQEACR